MKGKKRKEGERGEKKLGRKEIRKEASKEGKERTVRKKKGNKEGGF